LLQNGGQKEKKQIHLNYEMFCKTPSCQVSVYL